MMKLSALPLNLSSIALQVGLSLSAVHFECTASPVMSYRCVRTRDIECTNTIVVSLCREFHWAHATLQLVSIRLIRGVSSVTGHGLSTVRVVSAECEHQVVTDASVTFSVPLSCHSPLRLSQPPCHNRDARATSLLCPSLY